MKTKPITLIVLATFVGSLAALGGILAIVVQNWVSVTPPGTAIIYGFTISLTIITLVLGVLQIFPKLLAMRTNKSREQHYPIKVTLEVDETPITIQATDLDQVENIMKLAQHLRPNHPPITITAKVMPDSTMEKVPEASVEDVS